jgi:hypothetical protein
MTPGAVRWTALVAVLVLAAGVSCRGRETSSVAEMKAEIAALEKERDALRVRIGEGLERDPRVQGMPTTGVRVGVPTALASDLMTRVITGFVDQVTLKLGNIKVHKAGRVKKVITIGHYVLDVRIVEVTGKLTTGTPKLRFGGNEIGLDLPVRVASGTGTAVIDFEWDGKNVSGAVCGDMQIQQTVSGSVKPADYPVTGAVNLTATAQQILAAPKLPRVKIKIKVDPSAESWGAVQRILDSKEGLCGYVVDKVNILGILENLLEKGFNVRLPTEKIKPMAVPVGIAPTMTVRDRAVTIAVKVSQLAITPEMIWLGADVDLGQISPATPAGE